MTSADRQRVDALDRYAILDNPEPALVRVCQTAAKLLRAPAAAIALVGSERVWFKACHGLQLSEVSRAGSFFDHVIGVGGVSVVADAPEDSPFAAGLVQGGAPFFRFLAGAPLRAPEGLPVGALVVLDQQGRAPGALTELEHETLVGLADIVMDQIEVRAEARAERQRVAELAERRRVDAALLRTERLSAVGTLAAGVAHEINNPLTYVLANLDYVADRLGRARIAPIAGVSFQSEDQLAELQVALLEAQEGAQRVRRIVRDLRAFASGEQETLAPVDLRQALESAISVAWTEIRDRARLIRELGPVPPVEASEVGLRQVFLNILVNAAQSIREGSAEQNEIRVTTETDPKGHAVVRVQDSGAGITEDVIDRVFDPFFTTKPIGLGVGLGLFVSQGIIKALGGDIAVESAPGRGATFRVVLPAAVGAGRRRTPTPTPPLLPLSPT